MKKPLLFTLKERQVKINNIKLQLIDMNIYQLIPDESKNKINLFIDSGETYEEILNLSNCDLHITLINNKKQP